MISINRFYVVFILLVSLYGCSERSPDNIFDPDNNKANIELGFSVFSDDTTITLLWNRPANVNYTNIKIYRKTDLENSFSLYATIPKGIFRFDDTNIQFDIKHSYYLTVNSATLETKPTKTESIIPGPGSIWILDRYQWEVLKLSYDLSSTSIRKLAAWTPENLAFAHEIGQGLITYPLFGYAEIFNLQTGEILNGNIDLKNPYDAVYDNQHNLFWLIDSSGSMYVIDTADAASQLVNQELDNPVQIDIFQQTLFVLDQGVNKIYLFDTTPMLIDSIGQNDQGSNFKNLKLFRLDKQNQKLYLLDGEKSKNTLYKYDLNNNIITPVYNDSLIYSFDVNRMDETIWIVHANKVNSDLMQLSADGDRLTNISGFSRPIDVKVNKVNGNVVVSDFLLQAAVFAQKVFHYRSDLTLIGTFSTIGDPSKVYIE